MKEKKILKNFTISAKLVCKLKNKGKYPEIHSQYKFNRLNFNLSISASLTFYSSKGVFYSLCTIRLFLDSIFIYQRGTKKT